MSDYAKLKKLAEAVNAVTGDVNITMAMGTTQEEVTAVQDFLRAAMPKSILALLAELEQLKVGLERAKLIGRPAYNFDGYKQVLDERAHLKKQEIEVKAECEGLRERTSYWKQRAKSAEGHLWSGDREEACKALTTLKESSGGGVSVMHAVGMVLGVIEERRRNRLPADQKEISWCACGDGHAANSYGAGFMDANGGVCENCDAAQPRISCPLELFEGLRDSAAAEADEHRQHMAAYRPQRQEVFDAVVRQCDELIAAMSKEASNG